MKPEMKWFGAGAVLATVVTCAVLMWSRRGEARPGPGDVAAAEGAEAPVPKRAGEEALAEKAALTKKLETLEANAGNAQKKLAESEQAMVALRDEQAELKREIERLKPTLVYVLPTEPLTPEQIANLQKQAMDEALDTSARVDALLQLRRRTRDGRTPEVVRSVVGLLETCADASIRADVCRHLNGVDVAESREAMIRRLREDKDRKVREEAAETLATWKDDARVRAELEVAARGDEDEDVRDQAEKSLKGKK